MSKIQPAVTKMVFAGSVTALNDKYIDLSQCLSFVNRRKYEQGKCLYVESVKSAVYYGSGFLPAANSQVNLGLFTIPDTWVTRNAWTKAKALWNEMNDKVLDDNPSVQGKWRNFKVYMDGDHYSGGGGPNGPTLNLLPQNVAGATISVGEWEMSELVFPQHDVDPATGVVLAADTFQLHMMGANVGSLNSGGIIQMYEDTRARVVTSPEVPAEMSTSWGTLLSDDGSQEPELADIIELESDEPPYDKTDYVGADANWSLPCFAGLSIMSSFAPEDLLPGFAVPLGLLRIGCTEDVAYNTSAEENYPDQNPYVYLEVNIAKGHYKGVAATEMRQ